ncbi:hypothetical protein DERF_001216 [Dermatophagoides farinae]|uniref:Uncharacterized protein n=1 Tax=Dermatophagoides farinae TaxID=6954 RepID=A0A922IA29_DERFA|nr:hypothetical protein DERF_001216 [Dermatophagoides farinae]
MINGCCCCLLLAGLVMAAISIHIYPLNGNDHQMAHQICVQQFCFLNCNDADDDDNFESMVMAINPSIHPSI